MNHYTFELVIETNSGVTWRTHRNTLAEHEFWARRIVFEEVRRVGHWVRELTLIGVNGVPINTAGGGQ